MSNLPIFPQTRLQLLSEVIRRGISPTYSDSGTPVINQKCVRHNGTLILSHTRKHDTAARKISPDNYIQPGDALINSTGTGTLGRSAIVTTVSNPLTWDSHVTLVRPRSDYLDSRFLGYTLQMSENRFITLSQGSTNQIELSRDVVANLPLPALSLTEQRRIADYLDRETAQIDAMAEALDGLVARLEERRRAILGRAVRDEEGRFTLANVQAITTINSGDAIEASEIDQSGEYPVYGGNGVRGFTHRFNQTENRVLIGRQGALCGNVHIACAPFWASEHALVLTPHRKTDIRWLAYTLDDQGLGALSMSAAQPGITASGVGRQKIPLPPLDEQRRIADHLDAETAKIDAMIAKAGELRALLDERRSALITATVTGQHPVPEEP